MGPSHVHVAVFSKTLPESQEVRLELVNDSLHTIDQA